MNQIKNFLGERVTVDMKSEKKIEGALAFYDWDKHVIHLNSFVIFNKEGTSVIADGKFIIINQREWATLRVK